MLVSDGVSNAKVEKDHAGRQFAAFDFTLNQPADFSSVMKAVKTKLDFIIDFLM